MNKNYALVLVGVLGGLAAILLLQRRPREGTQASLSTRILDSLGNEVPHNSAAELEPGDYKIEATVTNLSTSQGEPVGGITLTTLAKVLLGSDYLLASFRTQGVYDANQSKIHRFGFSIPSDVAGFSGAIDVSVLDPNNNTLAEAILPFNVISYG